MSRPLRVVHVEAGRHLYGGAQQVLYLLRELHDRGHQSHLVCPPGSAVGAAAQALDIPVHPLGPGGDLDFGFRRRLADALRRIRPDVLHLHSRRGADFWGARAGRLAGVPVVMSRRVDNPEPRWLARLRYAPADRVVAISEGIASVLRAAGVPADKLRVVRSAVDPSPFLHSESRAALAQGFGLDPERPVAGVIAQLIPRKGHRILFEALATLGERAGGLQVLCLGRGPERKALAAHAARLGLAGRVVFGGFVDDLPRWLGALDLVIHPALMEGLGVSLLQASAAGVPIIAARAGGIPEAVRDGVNGRLVPPGNVPALAEAIAELVADPAARRALGAAGRRLVHDEFSTGVMAEGNLAVYRELLAA